jgi:hypothetical protein
VKLVALALDAREKRRTNGEGREWGIWLIYGIRMCINVLCAAEIAEPDFFSAVSAISAVNLSVSQPALENCHE